jgi:hypothetical protein
VGEARAAGVLVMGHLGRSLRRKQVKQGIHHKGTKNTENEGFSPLPAGVPVHIPREAHQRILRVLRAFVVKSLLARLP